jgi:hypothetical protein
MKLHECLDDGLTGWIERQHVFFVATAPSGAEGHVNVSPKGYDSFRVIDPLTVAYLDLTGSGVETIAHLRDNGRITLMFCAFEGPPQIVRLQGRGVVLVPGDPGFEALAARFEDLPGARAVIRVDLDRVSDSCGYSVPFMDYAGERPTLLQWAARKSPDDLDDYHRVKNAESIDGLVGLPD